jgi:hypothetical protein
MKTYNEVIAIAKKHNLRVLESNDVAVIKAKGIYDPKLRTITISSKLSEDEKAIITAHEVGHAIQKPLRSQVTVTRPACIQYLIELSAWHQAQKILETDSNNQTFNNLKDSCLKDYHNQALIELLKP